MTFVTVAALVAVITLCVDARAHVAPSVDDNNRYLKVTPLRGGYRLAYTVFFGEIPGASERKSLDTNRDGRIDDAEAKRFGTGLASQVGASLQLDGSGSAKPGSGRPVTWTVVDVGLGTPSVAAGAFSVDMIAYVCADGRMTLRDQFRIPRPGETEVVVEDSPGVTVKTARIGANDDARRDWRFLGAGGPLSDEGLQVVWTSTEVTPGLPASAPCSASAAPSGQSSRLPFVVGALVVVCAAVAGILVARRARKR
jgi:hypothetical protein